MSSLACPECRKEMLPQKDYDRAVCPQCGQTIYKPSEKLRKIFCTDCGDGITERKNVRVFKY